MKRSSLTWTLAICITLFAPACADDAPPLDEAAPASEAATTNHAMTDALLSDHMAAEAMLTAHFIAAAVRAGMSEEEINGALAAVAARSAISEFWITDETGTVVYTNIPGVEFAFPTDPQGDSQAAPFAALLSGDRTIVDQDFMPRELDGKIFKYVGAAGVDQARIVQIGVAAPTDSDGA